MSLLGKEFWNTIGQDKKILNLTPKDDLPKWLGIKEGGVVNCQYRAEILGTGGEIYNIYRIKMNYDEKATFCLLYTSPSPRDVHKSRMPSSA